MVKQEIRLNSAVADRIVAMLEEGPKTPAGWRETMAWFETESGPAVYAVLLFRPHPARFPHREGARPTGSASCSSGRS